VDLNSTRYDYLIPSMTRPDTESHSQTIRVPDNPKLAVIISCYNYESFVGRAIRSVIDQGRHDCELVVVDDESTDGSWDVIDRFGVTAFRVSNGGQRAACLFGLDRTRAPFILFLDADDELRPGALATIINQLDPEVAKLQFSLTLIDADDNQISEAASPLKAFRDRDVLARQVLRSGVYKTPPTSGNVFRRDLCELLREANYDKSVDGIILFAAPLMGDIVSISEELGCYRIHGRNDSGLGGKPDAALLERDISRFLARMEHLRAVVQRLGLNQELVESRDAFYFRERKLCLDIMTGRRPRLTALLGLLSKLADEPYPAKNKLAMALFFLLSSVLPNDRAKVLLAYRLKAKHRSMLGFARDMVGWRATLRN
jgi:glycosyltransferase involved in cell wall biosynthesis